MKIHLLVILFYAVGFSQSKMEDTRYSTKTKEVEAKIITNETVGYSQLKEATIKGQILDDKNALIENASITIFDLNLKKVIEIEADEMGKFNFQIEAGTYSFLVINNNFGQIQIDSLLLQKSQIQNIIVSLGSRYVIHCGVTVPSKEITINRKPNIFRRFINLF